jgi:hypothetical protein
VLCVSEKVGPTVVTVTPQGAIRFGKREWSVGNLEIIPAESPAVWVEGHQYRGTLRLYRVRQGQALLAINVLPLEEYVASVVDSEMPASFPEDRETPGCGRALSRCTRRGKPPPQVHFRFGSLNQKPEIPGFPIS